MRLIDADVLKRAIATIMPSRVDVNMVVDNQPTVMMKEQEAVVRCRDCKYGNVTFNGVVLCSKGGKHEPDWFCADGERRIQ